MSTTLVRAAPGGPARAALAAGGSARAGIRSPLRDSVRRFMASGAAMVGLAIVLAFVLMALAAPWTAPYGADQQSLTERLKPPSAQHLFGTDDLGRDVLSRVMFGSQISLRVGMLAVVLALVSGSTLGLVAGYTGGWLDGLFMRGMDIVLAFPSTLMAIGIVAMRGPSLEMALVAIGIVNIPTYARLARSMAISLKQREYVLAARCVGAGGPRLIGRHILPNALSPLIVQATLGIATAIIEAAGLGFLGLGAQPPTPRVGLDADQRARVSAQRAVGHDLPGRGHLLDNARLQPGRRRRPRRARSQPARLAPSPASPGARLCRRDQQAQRRSAGRAADPRRRSSNAAGRRTPARVPRASQRPTCASDLPASGANNG
jgi:peptide/nickel transport system permease protein